MSCAVLAAPGGDAATLTSGFVFTALTGEDARPGVCDRLLGAPNKPPPSDLVVRPGDAVAALAFVVVASVLSSPPSSRIGVVGCDLRALPFPVIPFLAMREGCCSIAVCPDLGAPAAAATFGRGSKLGLKRARLALVGDIKDARLGVVCSAS